MAKITNTHSIDSFTHYDNLTKVKVVPDLTHFEKHIGMTNAEDRHNFSHFVDTHRNDNPDWNKPTIRHPQVLDGSSIYKPSSVVELGVQNTSSFDTGGYVGVNHNVDGVCFDPIDNQVLLFFKGDVIQYVKDKVLIDTKSRIVVFPEIGTNPIESVYRSNPMDANNYWRLYFYDATGILYYYEVDNSSSTGYKHLGTTTLSHQEMRTARGADWGLWFKNDTNDGIQKVDVVGNTGNFVPYGTGTAVYTGLPNDVPVDACWNDKVAGIVYVSIGETIYALDRATTSVSSFGKYNQVEPSSNLKSFKWTKPNHPFQLNLDYGGDSSWDSSENPVAGSVQFWNGDRRSSATGIMTNGNWTDGEVYTLTLNKDATSMMIYSYGDSGVGVEEQGINWKIEGWGQTILRGSIGIGVNETILEIKQGSNKKPEYRPFDATLDVNPQEQFTQSNTEVSSYVINKKYDDIVEGVVLHPELTKIFNN
tara:strand:- start:45 stop:1475 length:1431 start_codon:yes stop_codon:yes gene_type:complete